MRVQEESAPDDGEQRQGSDEIPRGAWGLCCQRQQATHGLPGCRQVGQRPGWREVVHPCRYGQGRRDERAIRVSGFAKSEEDHSSYKLTREHHEEGYHCPAKMLPNDSIDAMLSQHLGSRAHFANMRSVDSLRN